MRKLASSEMWYSARQNRDSLSGQTSHAGIRIPLLLLHQRTKSTLPSHPWADCSSRNIVSLQSIEKALSNLQASNPAIQFAESDLGRAVQLDVRTRAPYSFERNSAGFPDTGRKLPNWPVARTALHPCSRTAALATNREHTRQRLLP